MRRECRGRFTHHRFQRKPLVRRSQHASRHVHHARVLMLVGIANPQWRGKRSRYSSACAPRKFTYLARGPWDLIHCWACLLLPPFRAINYNATYGRHITKPPLTAPSPSARWNLIRRLRLCQQPFICHGDYMGSKSYVEQYACENISRERDITLMIDKKIATEKF